MFSSQDAHYQNMIHAFNKLPDSQIFQKNLQLAQHKHRSKKIHKCKFSKEEDEKLCLLVKNFGENNWSVISKNMKNRNPRQCRERWKNYMNPRLIKDEFTEEEDLFLLNKYQEIGPHWNKIAQCFPKRSINSVRNRFVKLSKSIANIDSCQPYNQFDMNFHFENGPNKLIQQYNYPLFSYYPSNSAWPAQPFICPIINSTSISNNSKQQKAVIDISADENQSLMISDKNESKISDVTSNKKDLYDIFWNSTEETDILSLW